MYAWPPKKAPAERTSCGGLWACAIGAVFGGECGPASAQESSAPEDLETVVITGTNIRDSDIQSALPVQVIDAESIARSGARTAEQVMRQISANLIGASTATSQGIGVPAGMASVNLRGLGSGSTLVLLNGRRIANYAFDGGAVDLHSIPLAAVERIDVLKDGASAIYGADAMAGVINFVLRPDYAGAQLEGRIAETQHGGGNQQQITGSFGHGRLDQDGYNAFITVDWQDNQRLAAADRSYSRTSLIPEEGVNGLAFPTFPANIRIDGDLINPTWATGCAPPYSLPYPDSSACGFDFAPMIDSLPPLRQLSAVAGATVRLGDTSELYGQLVYARNDFTQRTAPTPIAQRTTFGAEPVLYPAGGPYYPTEFAAQNGLSGDLNIVYRTIPLGPRTQDVTTDAFHGTIALAGKARAWDYDQTLSFSRNSQDETLASGWISQQKFLPAMYSGIINPFGPSTPEGDALLQSTQTSGNHQGWGTTASIEAKASRTLRELSYGRLAMASGVELRREKLNNRFSEEFNAGDVLSLGANFLNTTSTRDVAALYAEFNVPLATNAAAQLAARYDHYSDFGGSVNPKLALRWEPVHGVLLRTSWATGFRPPTLYDLHTPVTRYFNFSDVGDPLRCPYTQSDADCTPSFIGLSGGNPELDPEESHQFNAGVVWSGIRNLSLSADFWQLHKTATVGALTSDTILGNYDAYEQYVTRGPIDPAYPDLPGPIASIDTRQQNLGDLRTEGVDVGVQWQGEPTTLGLFSFRLNGTYVSQWEEQLDGLHFTSGLGRNVEPVAVGAVPRWRHYATLDWDIRDWRVTLAENYTRSYIDVYPTPAGTERRVAAYDLWDLQVSYGGIRHAELAAGVRNLFDTDPPFSNQDIYQPGYNPRYSDPLGRVFYASVRYNFR